MRVAATVVVAACVALAAPAAPSSGTLPFRATLTASGHGPKLGRPWYYMVRVTDLRGRPIDATILPMVMQGRRRLDTVGSMVIWGACGRPYSWRSVHVGRALTFRVEVRTRRRVVNLDYAIRVTR